MKIQKQDKARDVGKKSSSGGMNNNDLFNKIRQLYPQQPSITLKTRRLFGSL
ncbi:9441_t:CDS:2 [Entrophospora sp. SA101]|nr:9441_t:CDS:2 [Entrophospora sp. SA101]